MGVGYSGQLHARCERLYILPLQCSSTTITRSVAPLPATTCGNERLGIPAFFDFFYSLGMQSMYTYGRCPSLRDLRCYTHTGILRIVPPHGLLTHSWVDTDWYVDTSGGTAAAAEGTVFSRW